MPFWLFTNIYEIAFLLFGNLLSMYKIIALIKALIFRLRHLNCLLNALRGTKRIFVLSDQSKSYNFLSLTHEFMCTNIIKELSSHSFLSLLTKLSSWGLRSVLFQNSLISNIENNYLPSPCIIFFVFWRKNVVDIVVMCSQRPSNSILLSLKTQSLA